MDEDFKEIVMKKLDDIDSGIKQFIHITAINQQHQKNADGRLSLVEKNVIECPVRKQESIITYLNSHETKIKNLFDSTLEREYKNTERDGLDLLMDLLRKFDEQDGELQTKIEEDLLRWFVSFRKTFWKVFWIVMSAILAGFGGGGIFIFLWRSLIFRPKRLIMANFG